MKCCLLSCIWTVTVFLPVILMILPVYHSQAGGNLPAVFKSGPSRRGICLIKLSEAWKTWYFLAVQGRRAA